MTGTTCVRTSRTTVRSRTKIRGNSLMAGFGVRQIRAFLFATMLCVNLCNSRTLAKLLTYHSLQNYRDLSEVLEATRAAERRIPSSLPDLQPFNPVHPHNRSAPSPPVLNHTPLDGQYPLPTDFDQLFANHPPLNLLQRGAYPFETMPTQFVPDHHNWNYQGYLPPADLFPTQGNSSELFFHNNSFNPGLYPQGDVSTSYYPLDNVYESPFGPYSSTHNQSLAKHLSPRRLRRYLA